MRGETGEPLHLAEFVRVNVRAAVALAGTLQSTSVMSGMRLAPKTHFDPSQIKNGRGASPSDVIGTLLTGGTVTASQMMAAS